jgi:hypothetical protein
MTIERENPYMTEVEKKYFEAGEKLRAVGASFLVSFLYYKKIDSKHSNWRLANTNNPSTIINNEKYWKIWLEAILDKDPASLSQNKISLSGSEIINMAQKLLTHFKDIK